MEEFSKYAVQIFVITCRFDISKETGIGFFGAEISQPRYTMYIEIPLEFRFNFSDKESFRDAFKEDLLGSFFSWLYSIEIDNIIS